MKHRTDNIDEFCNGKECQLILEKIQNEADNGKMSVTLYRNDFDWNYSMIKKCFTKYGYTVSEACFNDIVIDWSMKDKEDK